MSLLQLKNASVIIGQPPLLDGIDFVVQKGERVCLVGRNGCGKSTLLKIIAGEQALDDGQRIVSANTRISRLPQDPPISVESSLFDYVAAGMAEVGKLLQDYFHQTHLVANDPSEKQLAKLEALQQQLEHKNAWKFEQQILQILTKLELKPEQQLSSLSGGWRRKAALARALAGDPEILLLDEPTNHLDIEMINWLESSMLDYQGAIVFVSHDRAFIRNLATRIVDLDRGQLSSYPGNYAQYLQKKAQDLLVEDAQNAEFDKKLAQEERWIRQGIKARRTRNEGRVRALKALREEHSQRRKVQGRAAVTLQETASSGKMVFETKAISYAIQDQCIVKDLSLAVMRGDKVALIGPNGCGKSTLIKLLLEQLSPDSGTLRSGVNLQLAYFDQHRDQLEMDKSVVDAVAEGKREVHINGRSKHVISYLQDFLFTPDRINAPVHSLSGGEKNRLLLAKLLAKPSNLLILDEPTNDLDVETLELLEEVLSQYQGTVLLVSHDREFVDNVVTTSLFFEGGGVIKEFIGGYAEIHSWYQQQKMEQTHRPVEKKVVAKANTSTRKNKKLSYKDQHELNALPGKIETWEKHIEQLQQEINDPDFFKKDADYSTEKLSQLAEIESQLANAYARWDELESLQEQA